LLSNKVRDELKIDITTLLAADLVLVVIAKFTGLEQMIELRLRLPAGYTLAYEAMADAMLPISLMLSMASNQDLDLVAPVSRKLLSSRGTVQDVFHSWYPKKLQHIQVHASARDHSPEQEDGLTLSTFTAGVDAFYTLDKHFAEISSLLY